MDRLKIFITGNGKKLCISFLFVALATVLQLLLTLWITPPPFLLYYPAIVFASIYGEGLTAIFFSLLAIDYFFMGPKKLLDIQTTEEVILVAVFVLFVLLIRYLTNSLSRTRLEAEQLVENLKSERSIREQFVASLSHDLRTPIASAHISAQLYLKHPDEADAKKIMTRIIASTERAERMIRDLLDANSIRAGEKLMLKMDYCDLNTIAQEVIDEINIKTRQNHRLSIKAEDTVQGIWNAEALRRMLENLIDNAFKYGDTTSPITITLINDDGHSRFLVHNFGAALTDIEKEKIFNAFDRSPTAKQSGKPGWGIGLMLVKGLADAHGGSASVESGGSGTTFTVTLPRDSRGK